MCFIHMVLTFWVYIAGYSVYAVRISCHGNISAYLLDERRYDRFDHPNFLKGSPTDTYLYVKMLDIHSIDETNMDFVSEIFFQQRWRDPRLSYINETEICPHKNISEVHLDFYYIEKIWRPNVYFTTEKSATLHDVPQKNIVMYILPDGTIIYNMRMSMKHGCPMMLQLFPFDSQMCNITIESYSDTNDTVRLQWDEPIPLELPESEHRHFTLHRDVCISDTTNRPTKVGTFSSLAIFILLDRRWAHYVFQLFIPSGFIVTLSWISFWVDPKIVNARLAFGSVCVLTMITHHSHMQGSLPAVSYMKAIDIWTLFCQFFVFCVLIEYAFVYYMFVFLVENETDGCFTRKPKCYGTYGKTDPTHYIEYLQTSFEDTTESMTMSVYMDKKIDEKINKIQTDAQEAVRRVNHVDKWSRVVFPVAFVVFLLIFSVVMYVSAKIDKGCPYPLTYSEISVDIE